MYFLTQPQPFCKLVSGATRSGECNSHPSPRTEPQSPSHGVLHFVTMVSILGPLRSPFRWLHIFEPNFLSIKMLIASLNMSSVSALFTSDTLSLEHDVMSDITDPTTAASIQDLSDNIIYPDPSVIEDTQDAASSTSSSNMSCDTSEWEPPPGWCWSCWMATNGTGKCTEHAKN